MLKFFVILIGLLNLKLQAQIPFDLNYVKDVLQQSLINKPFRSLGNSETSIENAISKGFYSYNSEDYFTNTKNYEISDRLTGYIVFLLAQKQTKKLQDLFYSPQKYKWLKVWVNLERDIFNSNCLINLLDKSKQKLINSLKDKVLSSQKVEFYIPPLIDNLILEIVSLNPFKEENVLNEIDQYNFEKIIKDVAISQKAYGNSEDYIDRFIKPLKKDEEKKTQPLIANFKDLWVEGYLNGQESMLCQRKIYNKLHDKLSILTFRACIQQQDVSPYINSLFNMAIKTSWCALSSVGSVLDFIKLNHLSLNEEYTIYLLKVIDQLNLNGRFIKDKEILPLKRKKTLDSIDSIKNVLRLKIWDVSQNEKKAPRENIVYELMVRSPVTKHKVELVKKFSQKFNLFFMPCAKKKILRQIRDEFTEVYKMTGFISFFWHLCQAHGADNFFNCLLEVGQENFNLTYDNSIDLLWKYPITFIQMDNPLTITEYLRNKEKAPTIKKYQSSPLSFVPLKLENKNFFSKIFTWISNCLK